MANPTMNSGEGSNAITQINHGFITAQEYHQALLLEERDTHLIDPFGNQKIHNYLMDIGLKKRVHNIDYTHAEDTRSTEAYSLILATAGANGAAVTLTVQSKSIYSYNKSFYDGHTQTETTLMPRYREGLLFEGGIEGVVTNVDKANSQITVRPSQSDQAIPATASDFKVASTGIYSIEGGGSPDPWTTRMSQFENSLSGSEDAIEMSDIAMAERMVIQSSDGMQTGWTLKGHVWQKKLDDFHNKMDARLLAGRRITNQALLDDIGGQVSTGNGHFSYIDTFGETINYTTNVGITDFDQMINNIYSIGAPRKYLLAGQKTRMLQIEDLLRANAGEAEYSTNKPDGGPQTVNHNINKFYRGNVEFSLGDFDVLNNPEVLGTSYNDKVIAMPIAGSIESGKSRTNYVNIACLHSDEMGYKDGYLERIQNGLQKNATIDDKKIKYDISCYKNIECYGQKVHMQLDLQP